jgi:hypothetical protein
VQNWNRPTAQCSLVFVLLPAQSHTGLDWPSPPGLFPLRTCLELSRPPRAAHAAAAPVSAPLASPRLLRAEAKPHLSSPLHSNCRRVLAHSALPLTAHLHSKRWPLSPAFMRLHATALHKDRCSTEPAASFIAEVAFPSTTASGAPPALSTPPVASPEL